MMMAVSFERYGRLYYLDPGAYSPAIGDKVLVPTDSGPEVAECVWAPQWVSEDIDGLPVCAGLATEDDLARDEENRRRRAEGRLAARRLIREHELPMKVTAVDYIGPENVFVVYFSAPHRVDFRALVRDLGGRLKARVELRQIGPRDEARLQGGIGPVRARPVLRHVPEGLRAGVGPDGQGPGPAGEPAADRRGVRAADVLPEVRAPAVPGLPQGRPAGRRRGHLARRAGHGRRPQRSLGHGGGEAVRGRAGLRLPEGQRVRVPAGLRGDARQGEAREDH